MARYGPADAEISYSATVIPDATVIGDLSREVITEEITPIGADDETHASVGVKRMAPITIEAPYSDDSNNLQDKLFDVGLGGTATLLVTFGGTKTVSVSTILQKIDRVITRGRLSIVRGTLVPTGAVTEA
jgi:hypothetical protein